MDVREGILETGRQRCLHRLANLVDGLHRDDLHPIRERRLPTAGRAPRPRTPDRRHRRGAGRCIADTNPSGRSPVRRHASRSSIIWSISRTAYSCSGVPAVERIGLAGDQERELVVAAFDSRPSPGPRSGAQGTGPEARGRSRTGRYDAAHARRGPPRSRRSGSPLRNGAGCRSRLRRAERPVTGCAAAASRVAPASGACVARCRARIASASRP